MTTEPTIDPTILPAAADYIREHGWTKGTERDENGAACITGAIRYCRPIGGDFFLIREVLRQRDRAEFWNDNAATREEVISYLDSWEITDADLAKVFGPQWAQIVALVRKAFSMSVEMVELLKQAHDDVRRPAAHASAYAAASAADVAAACARAAARDAARAAARDAAYASAAASAAAALAARHLIGRHGFTQSDYDILTRPWRTVVGPIHPDDAPLTYGYAYISGNAYGYGNGNGYGYGGGNGYAYGYGYGYGDGE